MEENRLKPMPGSYDPKLFNQLFKDTEKLRRKLTYQIDARRFGVDPEEIYSWFSVKFLLVFTRYTEEGMNPDLLKGHMISSLSFFKNRILRWSYSQKAQIHNTIDIQEAYSFKETTVEHDYNEKDTYLKVALDFMKSRMSPEAYKILQVELNPPLYILDQLSDTNKTSNTKIPSALIADYLGMGTDERSVRYVNNLRKEIQGVTAEAHSHFNLRELV